MLESIEINIYGEEPDKIYGLFNFDVDKIVSVASYEIRRDNGDIIMGSKVVILSDFGNLGTRRCTLACIESPQEIDRLKSGDKEPIELCERPDFAPGSCKALALYPD